MEKLAKPIQKMEKDAHSGNWALLSFIKFSKSCFYFIFIVILDLYEKLNKYSI